MSYFLLQAQYNKTETGNLNLGIWQLEFETCGLLFK